MKYSRREVAYTDKGTDAEHCSICRHYINATTCRIVAGRIEPGGWCKKFDKAPIGAREQRLEDKAA